MKGMKRVAWDISHSEFAVLDHYYFSRLLDVAKANNILIEEVDSIDDLGSYDVLVINYPEEYFKDDEVDRLKQFVRGGGILIVLAYYENKDDSARAANSISKRFGVKFNEDSVRSKFFDENEYIIVTEKIKKFSDGVKKVVIPCPCSVEGGESFIFEQERDIPLFTYVKEGSGMGIFGGSCSFWDNHSLMRADNKTFAMNILNGKD